MCEKNLVELSWHLAVVPCVVIKFGAAWRGGAVVDSSGNCRGGEGLAAKDMLIEEVVILVANDVTDAAWDDGSDSQSFNAGEGGFRWW
jgi:hypothetical protein